MERANIRGATLRTHDDDTATVSTTKAKTDKGDNGNLVSLTDRGQHQKRREPTGQNKAAPQHNGDESDAQKQTTSIFKK